MSDKTDYVNSIKKVIIDYKESYTQRGRKVTRKPTYMNELKGILVLLLIICFVLLINTFYIFGYLDGLYMGGKGDMCLDRLNNNYEDGYCVLAERDEKHIYEHRFKCSWIKAKVYTSYEKLTVQDRLVLIAMRCRIVK